MGNPTTGRLLLIVVWFGLVSLHAKFGCALPVAKSAGSTEPYLTRNEGNSTEYLATVSGIKGPQHDENSMSSEYETESTTEKEILNSSGTAGKDRNLLHDTKKTGSRYDINKRNVVSSLKSMNEDHTAKKSTVNDLPMGGMGSTVIGSVVRGQSTGKTKLTKHESETGMNDQLPSEKSRNENKETIKKENVISEGSAADDIRVTHNKREVTTVMNVIPVGIADHDQLTGRTKRHDSAMIATEKGNNTEYRIWTPEENPFDDVKYENMSMSDISSLMKTTGERAHETKQTLSHVKTTSYKNVSELLANVQTLAAGTKQLLASASDSLNRGNASAEDIEKMLTNAITLVADMKLILQDLKELRNITKEPEVNTTSDKKPMKKIYATTEELLPTIKDMLSNAISLISEATHLISNTTEKEASENITHVLPIEVINTAQTYTTTTLPGHVPTNVAPEITNVVITDMSTAATKGPAGIIETTEPAGRTEHVTQGTEKTIETSGIAGAATLTSEEQGKPTESPLVSRVKLGNTTYLVVSATVTDPVTNSQIVNGEQTSKAEVPERQEETAESAQTTTAAPIAEAGTVPHDQTTVSRPLVEGSSAVHKTNTEVEKHTNTNTPVTELAYEANEKIEETERKTELPIERAHVTEPMTITEEPEVAAIATQTHPTQLTEERIPTESSPVMAKEPTVKLGDTAYIVVTKATELATETKPTNENTTQSVVPATHPEETQSKTKTTIVTIIPEVETLQKLSEINEKHESETTKIILETIQGTDPIIPLAPTTQMPEITTVKREAMDAEVINGLGDVTPTVATIIPEVTEKTVPVDATTKTTAHAEETAKPATLVVVTVPVVMTDAQTTVAKPTQAATQKQTTRENVCDSIHCGPGLKCAAAFSCSPRPCDGSWMAKCEQNLDDPLLCRYGIDKGPGPLEIQMWAFVPSTGKCTDFVFGGSHGNGNRFPTKENCEQKCVVHPK